MYPRSSSLLLEDRGIDGHSSFRQESLLALTPSFVKVTSTTATTTLNTADPRRKPQHKLKLPSLCSRPLHLVTATGPLAFLSKFASKCVDHVENTPANASTAVCNVLQRHSAMDGTRTCSIISATTGSYTSSLKCLESWETIVGEHACHLTKTGNHVRATRWPLCGCTHELEELGEREGRGEGGRQPTMSANKRSVPMSVKMRRTPERIMSHADGTTKSQNMKKPCESLASRVKHVSFETQSGHQFFRPRPALVPDLENLANISSPRVCGEDHIKDDVDGRIRCLSPPFPPQHGRNGVQTNSGSPQSFEVHMAY